LQKPAVGLFYNKAYGVAAKKTTRDRFKANSPYLNASIITPAPMSASASHSRRLGRSPKKITAMITTSTTLSLSIGAT